MSLLARCNFLFRVSVWRRAWPHPHSFSSTSVFLDFFPPERPFVVVLGACISLMES